MCKDLLLNGVKWQKGDAWNLRNIRTSKGLFYWVNNVSCFSPLPNSVGPLSAKKRPQAQSLGFPPVEHDPWDNWSIITLSFVIMESERLWGFYSFLWSEQIFTWGCEGSKEGISPCYSNKGERHEENLKSCFPSMIYFQRLYIRYLTLCIWIALITLCICFWSKTCW